VVQLVAAVYLAHVRPSSDAHCVTPERELNDQQIHYKPPTKDNQPNCRPGALIPLYLRTAQCVLPILMIWYWQRGLYVGRTGGGGAAVHRALTAAPTGLHAYTPGCVWAHWYLSVATQHVYPAASKGEMAWACDAMQCSAVRAMTATTNGVAPPQRDAKAGFSAYLRCTRSCSSR
jgi:hypothetical protein